MLAVEIAYNRFEAEKSPNLAPNCTSDRTGVGA